MSHEYLIMRQDLKRRVAEADRERMKKEAQSKDRTKK